jgi:molecular chaperone Hsp33
MTKRPISPANADPASPRDDLVMPFATREAGVIGRLVRLGASADTILSRHAYPEPVSAALGEALVLAALLGSALKFDGQLILQTKTDGPLGMLVADYVVPGYLRGYASSDAARLATVALPGTPTAALQGQLLGQGYLAMTIDPGGDMDRYQGIVPLDGDTLTDAAHTYFRQSEQLPTLIRLAVARHFAAGAWHWRAGGLMIQQVARTGGLTMPSRTSDEERDAALEGEDDENWTRIKLLAATVEDHELTDPTLDPHRLLYRLFHEEGVTARPAAPLIARCRCSRDRLLGYLKGFDAAALADLRDENGRLAATCEFCSTVYTYGTEDGVL